MNVNYLNDSDLDFLQHCSEEQLANFARLLTHNEKGKTRLSSVLMRNELFKSMEGHPERHRRNWQLIAGEFQHFGGDSIANKLRGHGKLYRAILLDVSKRLKLKADKEMSTFEIEQQLLEQFLRNTWKKMDEEHKQEFLHAVDARVNELEELLPLLMKDKLLAKGREEEARKLLRWGQQNFTTVQILHRGKKVGTERIWYGDKENIALGTEQEFWMVLPKAEIPHIKAKYTLDGKELTAPISAHQRVGEIELYDRDQQVAHWPLVTLESVGEGSMFSRLSDYFHHKA